MVGGRGQCMIMNTKPLMKGGIFGLAIKWTFKQKNKQKVGK